MSQTGNTLTYPDSMPLEITDDPITLRTILQEMISALRGKNGKASTRERALAITKLQEAEFWLGEDAYRNGI